MTGVSDPKPIANQAVNTVSNGAAMSVKSSTTQTSTEQGISIVTDVVAPGGQNAIVIQQ